MATYEFSPLTDEEVGKIEIIATTKIGVDESSDEDSDSHGEREPQFTSRSLLSYDISLLQEAQQVATESLSPFLKIANNDLDIEIMILQTQSLFSSLPSPTRIESYEWSKFMAPLNEVIRARNTLNNERDQDLLIVANNQVQRQWVVRLEKLIACPENLASLLDAVGPTLPSTYGTSCDEAPSKTVRFLALYFRILIQVSRERVWASAFDLPVETPKVFSWGFVAEALSKCTKYKAPELYIVAARLGLDALARVVPLLAELEVHFTVEDIAAARTQRSRTQHRIRKLQICIQPTVKDDIFMRHFRILDSVLKSYGLAY